jgi:hypothetical protein
MKLQFNHFYCLWSSSHFPLTTSKNNVSRNANISNLHFYHALESMRKYELPPPHVKSIVNLKENKLATTVMIKIKQQSKSSMWKEQCPGNYNLPAAQIYQPSSTSLVSWVSLPGTSSRYSSFLVKAKCALQSERTFIYLLRQETPVSSITGSQKCTIISKCS